MANPLISKSASATPRADPAAKGVDLFSRGSSPRTEEPTGLAIIVRCSRPTLGDIPERLAILDALLDMLGAMSAAASLPKALLRGVHQTRVAFERAKLAPRRADEHQGDLFGYHGSERFGLVFDFEREAANLASELAGVLLPLDLQARTRASRTLQRQAPACAPNVTRLAFARPDALSWSLYSAFDSDTATRAAVRRLARAKVRTLAQFVTLAEPKAHALADPTLEAWTGIRRRLGDLGLAFAITGERRQERNPVLSRRANIDEPLVKDTG